jgi:hypothetical protein
MSLRRLMKEELPLNRKERFFTGTVLPMIVCRDGFRHLHALLELVGCREPLRICAAAGQENIQFFSEYSFVESVVGEARKRFSSRPSAKDTPDIVILVRTEQAKVLVAMEAKVFDCPTAQDLTRQMERQRTHILACLEQALHIDRTYHVALLPAKLCEKVKRDGFDLPAVTWEDLCTRYRGLLGSDYFLEVLSIALERYDELAAQHAHSYRKNCQDLYRGSDIYRNYKEGMLDKQVMGRKLGLHGSALREDVNSGDWRKRKYEVSSNAALAENNRNWFYVRDFVDLVDQAHSTAGKSFVPRSPYA